MSFVFLFSIFEPDPRLANLKMRAFCSSIQVARAVETIRSNI
jgi:hypothetical protein